MRECQASLTLTPPASMLTELIWVSPVTNALVYVDNITTSLFHTALAVATLGHTCPFPHSAS